MYSNRSLTLMELEMRLANQCNKNNNSAAEKQQQPNKPKQDRDPIYNLHQSTCQALLKRARQVYMRTSMHREGRNGGRAKPHVPCLYFSAN
jgi:hypothetical protein